MRYKIVMTDHRHTDYEVEKEILRKIGGEVLIADCRTVEDVIDACKDADGIMLNLAPMTAEAVSRLERCKIIARYGVGYDNVDVGACTKRGICVTNVPDYCAEEVSDHALALMLACARQIVRRDATVRGGKWNISGNDQIHRIAGGIFTFLGFGTIARCLRRKISGLNFARILVYDPYVDEKTIQDYGVEKAGWETAIKEGDFISVHMPANEQTRGLVGAAAYAMMKPTAILINTARGSVVDEAALLKALQDKTITAAGLDVFQREPLAAGHPFLTLNNCVLTDHIGWYSEEAMVELKRKVAENIRDVLEGNPPKYPVNAKLA